MNKLLTSKQVAEYLQLKPVSVRRKAKKGEIPSIRIGNRIRFHKHEIDRWLLNESNRRLWHILVIDDEPLIGELFMASLNEPNYQVTTVLSGVEALELIENNQFDLIFLDLLIPDLDGSEVLKHIKKRDKDILVIIITGYPDSDLMNKAMDQGAFVVMKKPFDSEQILTAVSTFTKSAGSYAKR